MKVATTNILYEDIYPATI